MADVYPDDLSARYKELRNLGIISTKHFMSHINEWFQRIGFHNFQKEYLEKWQNSPCFRDSKLNSNYWKSESYVTDNQWSSTITYSEGNKCLYYNKVWQSITNNNIGNNPLNHPESWKDLTYNSSVTYLTGEQCYYGQGYWQLLFTAVTDTTSNPPLTGFYDDAPNNMGYYDSLWRYESFIEQTINALDIFTNYNKN